MKLTVLGCSGSYAGARGPCSSYLVEGAGTRLLLDCGNGSLSNLVAVTHPAALDAVVVSHRHPDHWADLAGLAVALRWGGDEPRSVPLYGPAELADPLRAFAGRWVGQVLPFTPCAPGQALAVGGLRLSLHPMRHPPATLGVRVHDGERVLAYTADTDVDPAVVELARGADLVVADCSYPDELPREPGVHMSAADAGRLAAEAGARRLLVTHVWPDFDAEVLGAEAADAFGGETIVASARQEIAL